MPTSQKRRRSAKQVANRASQHAKLVKKDPLDPRRRRSAKQVANRASQHAKLVKKESSP